MTRLLDDWIASYVVYMSDTEYPTSYHVWNAISCIAGALQRRVYMPWGRQTIYPNMYIVLVGPSAIGKGESMRPMIDIFTQIPSLSVAPDSITIQELVSVMSKLEETSFTDHIGRFQTQTAIQIFAKELVVLLGTKDMKKVSILTDLYDSHDVWKDSTKTQGKYELTNVCVNFLGASAPDWFATMLPLESMGGGFTSRFIFVVETKKAKLNPFPDYTDEHKRTRDMLIKDLSRIATLAGPFEFTQDAMELYKKYYFEQETAIQKGIYPVKDPAFHGYAGRRMLHLRKMSIALAASRGSEGDVIPNDFTTAIRILKAAEAKMPRLFGGVGRGPLGPVINNVLSYLLEHGDTWRSTLLRAFYQDIDSTTMDVIESTLTRMNFIKPVRKEGKNDVFYAVNKEWDG